MKELINIKDRTDSFDDYYSCMQQEECNLSQVPYNWIQRIVSSYNNTITNDNTRF